MDHGRQHPGTPATRCATSFIPVAVSLSNAPPTATPSSVMGPKSTAPVASQERCKSPDGGLRSMRLMLGDGADGLWCRFRVCAALGQWGRGFEQRAA
jgi:hypothetical protein